MASFVTQRRKSQPKTSRGTLCHFLAGPIIFDSEHPSRQVYLLSAGQVRLFSGPNAIVEHVNPGSFFGEGAFLGRPRSAQIATALSPVTATAYRRAELLRSLRDGRFAGQFLRDLVLRMHQYEQAIRDFVTERAERRLARLLSRSIPGRSRGDWVRLSLPATNEGLARMIGTTRWSISRLMNRFQRLGWLRRQQDLWVHREGLQRFLE